MNFNLILFSILFSTTSLVAQEADSAISQPLGIIDTIIVSGNHKTKAYVILDEMALKPGILATSEAIEYDRSRIYSLGLFTRVDIFYDSLQGQRFLAVDVSERWYLIPVPLFGFRDGDPKKPYYGAGVLHNNVGGNNQKLFASAVFGHNPSFELFFADPLIDRPNNLYASEDISLARIRNRSEREILRAGSFDERHFDVHGTLGKRFSLYETLGLSAGFHYVEVTNYQPGRTISPRGRDRYIYGTLSYTYDSRDLREYAASGSFISLSISKNGFGEFDVNFTRFSADFRRYIPLPATFTLATRVDGTIVSGGEIPTYSRSYFGYGERIRGYFKTVFEGENLFGGSVELRFPLLPARTITFTAIRLPTEFSIWRFGICLALFVDTGVTWFRGEGISLNSFASGYGGGVHFLLPYSVVLRTEYAFNEYRKGQFIFDLRASF